MLIPIRNSFHFQTFESSITSSHQLPINQQWHHSNLFQHFNIKLHFPKRKERERGEEGREPALYFRDENNDLERPTLSHGDRASATPSPLSSALYLFPKQGNNTQFPKDWRLPSKPLAEILSFLPQSSAQENIQGKEIKRAISYRFRRRRRWRERTCRAWAPF